MGATSPSLKGNLTHYLCYHHVLLDMATGITYFSAGTHRGKAMERKGVSQYVRTAEQLLNAGKYAMALEALSVAQELEPHNASVRDILDRALTLQAQTSSRYLSVTVGNQFARGVRTPEDETALSPQEIRARIQYLVEIADVFLDRGMTESALDSLMRAYLLDPLAPEVISSEQRILPVLEMMRNAPQKLNSDTSGPLRVEDAGKRSKWGGFFKRKTLEQ
jgi:tetratricopeptide (TPR) repeat protein